MYKKIKLDLFRTPYIKINSKWVATTQGEQETLCLEPRRFARVPLRLLHCLGVLLSGKREQPSKDRTTKDSSYRNKGLSHPTT